METAAVRPLGVVEGQLADTHASTLGGTQFTCVAELAGAVDAATARAALEHLRAWHPLLRTDLVRRGRGWHYVRADRAELPFTAERGDFARALGLAAAEIDRPAGGDGPLWRATLVGGRDRGALVVTAHHAITDGMSQLALALQFVAACNAASAGESLLHGGFPVREPVERLLAAHAAPVPPGSTAEPVAPAWAVEQEAPVAGRRTRTAWHVLEPPDTADLLRRCRAEGVTVNSVLVAALAEAAQRLPTRRDALCCLVPVSVRDHTTPRVHPDENGTFITEISFTLGAGDLAVPLWERARSVRERHLRLRERALAAPTDFRRWPGSGGAGTFRRGSLVTNLGRGVRSPGGGPLRLESFRFVVSPRPGNYAISLSAATVGDRMVLGISSVRPLLSDASADAFAGAFTAVLHAGLPAARR